MKKEDLIMWTIKPFDELTTKELFDIYYLRTAVFVVERSATTKKWTKRT